MKAKIIHSKKTNYLNGLCSIVPKDKPIVFWDTCSLLDIYKVLLIPKTGGYRTLQHYYNILNSIQKGELTSVTSKIVYKEFAQHYEDFIRNITSNEDSIKETYKDYAATLSEAKKIEILTAVDKLSIVPILDKLVRDIWRNTYVIKEQLSFQNSAHYRVIHKEPPAKTKGEYKDSYIWATYLSLAKKLDVVNKEHPWMCFITSNVKDYGDNTHHPQEGIFNECNRLRVKIVFSVDVLWSEYMQFMHPAPPVLPEVTVIPATIIP